MAARRTTASDVLADIHTAKAARIGIDGIDGSGKSTLAGQISAALNVPVVSVDEFLEKNQGGYVPFIDIGRLSAAATDRFIIEGVCLLEVLERADIGLDLSITYSECTLDCGPMRSGLDSIKNWRPFLRRRDM